MIEQAPTPTTYFPVTRPTIPWRELEAKLREDGFLQFQVPYRVCGFWAEPVTLRVEVQVRGNHTIQVETGFSHASGGHEDVEGLTPADRMRNFAQALQTAAADANAAEGFFGSITFDEEA